MLNSPIDVEGPWSDRYEVQDCIGQGHAGTVYRAIDTTLAVEARESKEVAVKVYKDKNMFKREVQMMKRLRGHRNVMQLLTTHTVPTMSVVMPFYSAGDLHSYVWNHDGLSEARAASVTSDLLSALQHIHGLDIIHRDIKPENVSMDHKGRPVLMDFDIACKSESSEAISGSLCGSPGYMAPEIIAGKSWSFSSDVFAIGCVAYFMFAKMHPFPTKPMIVESVLEKNAECRLRFGRRFDNVSPACIAFISSIVVRIPERRLSEQEASAHPWLKEEVLCSSTLKPVASRATAGTTADVSTEDDRWGTVVAMPAERPQCSKGGNSKATFRVSKVRTVGRDIANRFSRALGGLRRKTNTTTRLQSKCDNFTNIGPGAME